MKTEEEKRTGFNVLDIAVILVILVLIVTVFVRSGIVEKLTFSGKEFAVTCHIEDTDGLQLDSLRNVDLYTENDHVFGSVKEFRYLVNGEGKGYYEMKVFATLMKKDGRFVTEEGISVVKNATLDLHSQLVRMPVIIDKVE